MENKEPEILNDKFEKIICGGENVGHREMFADDITQCASDCSALCTQEKIDLLNEILSDNKLNDQSLGWTVRQHLKLLIEIKNT